MMILRTAGVSIPPQLMRGPYEPGYRDREPIVVSVSAARPVVKAGRGYMAVPPPEIRPPVVMQLRKPDSGSGHAVAIRPIRIRLIDAPLDG